MMAKRARALESGLLCLCRGVVLGELKAALAGSAR